MSASSPISIELTRNPIAPQQLVDFVTSPLGGAVVLFLGTVRELTHGRATQALEYDSYPEMALKILHELAEETCARWPVLRVAVAHRLGQLELTETSVAIAVSTPHRKEAFAAGQFLIDELKSRVPIWKKEIWADGTTEWVHPGTA